jgi:Na+(H+)/acetate symporter ActP
MPVQGTRCLAEWILQLIEYFALISFALFVAVTLLITAWASRRTGSRGEYYVAGGAITGMQNGVLVYWSLWQRKQ